MADTVETKDELLKSYHQQFAENQNHHQTVFIQFISAVFVVIVGYAFVYTNTSSKADVFNSIKGKDQQIISYAIVHLMGSYFFAQIILTLLCTLIMNVGYGFRRDQNVVYNIRNHYLVEGLYSKIFGTKSFNPKNKNWSNFLPEFNSIFVKSILVIQVFLISSIIYSLTQFDNFQLNLCVHWWRDGILVLAILLPFICSIFFYLGFYRKYKKAVN